MITSDNLFIAKVNRLIDENLNNPTFSIDTLCQTLGVSRSQLHRTIKEQTELSTTLYIRKRRLLKARHLLITTDLRISEIGDIIGITNPQNFSTYFIEAFRVSPSDFRKQQNQPPTVVEPQLSLEPVPDVVSLPTQPTESRLVPAKSRPVHRQKLVYVVSAAGLLLIIGLILYQWLQSRPVTRTAQPAGNSIAMMPFTNLGTADSDPACEGIMDDVHTSISLIKNLKVIARSSSDQYKDTQKSIWQIGDELQVANVLKGSVLKTANQIQVKIEIINTKDDIRMWSHIYKMAYKDIFQLTDQIVEDIVRQLKLTINTPTSEKLALARTQNLEAYNLFLQGKHLMITRTKPNLQESLIRFDRALTLDSTFAEVYASKALVYFLFIDEGYADAVSSMKLAEKNALTAIRLDPENANAFAMLAKFYQYQNKWEQANTTYRIALQYQPNNALTNYWYSLMLRSVGQAEQAIRYSTKAVTIDPLLPVIMVGHIGNLSYARQFTKARQVIQDGQQLHAGVYSWYWATAFYYLNQNLLPQTLREFEKGQRLNPNSVAFNVQVAYVKARLGQPGPAQALLRSLPGGVANYPDRATLYAGLGDTDRCLDYLEKGADAGCLPNYVKVSPMFQYLRNNPRFQAVLKKVGLDKINFSTR